MHLTPQAVMVSFVIIALAPDILNAANNPTGSDSGLEIKNPGMTAKVVNEGDTVKLQCDIVVSADRKDDYSVLWNYEESHGESYWLAINTMTDGLESDKVKVNVTEDVVTRSSILTIESIQVSEKGLYSCNLIFGQFKQSKVFDVEVLSLSLDSHEEIVGIRNKIKELKDKISKTKQCIEPMVGFTAYSGPGAILYQKGEVPKFMAPKFNIGVFYTGDYDKSTGKFTCMLPGWYRFSVNIVAHEDSNGNVHIMLQRDKQRRKGPEIIATAYAEQDDWNTAATSAVIELHIGDDVWLQAGQQMRIYASPGEKYRHTNVFSGNLIRAAACDE